MFAYAYNSTVATASHKIVKRKHMTKRAFAIETLMKYEDLLDTHGHKIYRKTCLDAILANFPGTTPGSLGAIYNNAKHALIEARAMGEFGRYKMGRNKHSKSVKLEAKAA